MTRIFAAVSFLVTFSFLQTGTAQNINTVAGGIGTTGIGTSVGVGNPYAIATDTSGNFYVADAGYNVIRKITPLGIISTVAGNGTKGSTGNGGTATAAALNNPMGVAADRFGNIFVSESGNNTIRRIDNTGTITLYAGTGISGYGGDAGPATSAMLANPVGLATDNAGNLYITDRMNCRVRKINTSGIITTIAGTGSASFSGDGFPATAAELNKPIAVAIEATGCIFFIDQDNERVRKIDNSGIISTIAGTGVMGNAPDGTPATAATFTYPTGLCFDAAGKLYIADKNNFKVRYIDAGGLLQSFAGGGINHPGDGGSADSAFIFRPSGIAFDINGNLGIAVGDDKRVCRVNTAHVINTIAGNNTNCLAGDGGLATAAQTFSAMSVAVDNHGNMFVSDATNSVIRKINTAGIISTYAGTGASGFSGDNGPATSAKLSEPRGLVTDPSGNLFVADYTNHCIRKISPSGIITTVAGTGISGGSGNGTPATASMLSYPVNLNLDGNGNLYICDWGNNMLEMVDTFGNIHHLAGCYSHMFSGDGGPATAACINLPYSVCVDNAGNIYFGDVNNARIRVIDPTGTINTFAGTGVAGFSGDGGPATAARINFPSDMEVGPDGSIYFTDALNNVVRKIAPDHTISTIVGDTLAGFSGDGGPASAALLSRPMGLSFDPWGNYYIADWLNNRVRKVGNNLHSYVQEVADDKKLVIYPNPGNGQFTFYFPTPQNEQLLISIMDISGREVFRTRMSTNQKTPIFTEQPAGMYIVTATTAAGRHYQKLVIEK